MTNPIDRRTFVSAALTSATMAGATFATSVVHAQALAQAKRPTPPPLSAYGKLPDIEAVALSPDAKRVALIKDKDAERVVFDYEFATGKSSGLNIERAKLFDLFWADNERVVVLVQQNYTTDFYSKPNNDVVTRGVIADLHKKKYTVLQATQGSRNILGNVNRYKVDDKWYISACALDYHSGKVALYMFDTKNASVKSVPAASRAAETTRSDSSVQMVDWGLKPDASLHVRRELSVQKNEVYISFYRDEKWYRVLTHKTLSGVPTLCGLGPDGESTVVMFHTGLKAGRLCLISPDGTVSDPIDPVAEFSIPIFHPATNRLAGFEIRGDKPEYRMTDPVMAKTMAQLQDTFSGYRIEVVSMAMDPRQLIVYSEGPGDAGSYTFVDYSTGNIEEIGKKYPEVTEEWVAEHRSVHYTASDGLEIEGFITLPPGRAKKALPLVVLPHDGPRMEDKLQFDWMAQALATRGYVVFQPNYRGSTGYGADFISKGLGETAGKILSDVSDGVQHLVSQGLVNPARTAIAGIGFGGYMALTSLALKPDVYNCAVSISGFTDIKSYMVNHQDQPGYRTYWENVWGERHNWDAISPTSLAGRIKAPVMLIHGRSNLYVPYDQSTQMSAALSKARVQHELIPIAQDDHTLSTSESRLEALGAMVRFLETHNPPWV